jgi:iron complex transport system ATP-binding protein
MTVAIRVSELRGGYGAQPVLDRVSLRVGRGRFTALLGRNGSGKSTLLKAIGGQLPSDGEILVMGQDLSRISTRERARRIGYLPQFHSPVFAFSVEDVVLTGRAAQVATLPGAADRGAAKQALARVGLEHLRARAYSELSGGERQLVMFARILAQGPQVVLLDEPLAHLDLPNQVGLIRLIHALRDEGITILAVLHDPNLVFLHADEVIFLKEGKVLEPAADTLPWDSGLLAAVYGAALEVIPFRDRALVVPQ